MGERALIQRRPPRDGKQYEPMCARCGSTLSFETCEGCGGDGTVDDDDGTFTCSDCGGDGYWPLCISTAEYCQGHPLPGREDIERNMPEWFAIPAAPRRR